MSKLNETLARDGYNNPSGQMIASVKISGDVRRRDAEVFAIMSLGNFTRECAEKLANQANRSFDFRVNPTRTTALLREHQAANIRITTELPDED